MNKTSQKQLFSSRIIAETVVLVSLGGALSLISHSFFSLPQGGSINIGMVPIFWLAIRRGKGVGILGGALFGVVDLAIEPFVVHPLQLALDYPLAFAALGLAGAFQKHPFAGVLVGGTGRFLCHFVSGILYFSDYAPPGMSPILYSAIYNGTYLVPSIIISAIVIGILQKSKALNIYL
ncbi:TPA: energy-coupled thiamine transporter ThiT [Candidatus Bathyarchaeota archaeon]|nr:energy-coupled thiamine transporter ThiT [Candidatus Bathyarchaeota archaeon]